MSMMPVGMRKTSVSSIYLCPLGATKLSTGSVSRDTETSPKSSRGEAQGKKAKMKRKNLDFLQENHAVDLHLSTVILTMVNVEP